MAGERVQSVGFDPVEEVIISCVEQLGDSRDVIATIAKTFPATQQQVQALLVGSRSHPGPSWRRILDARDDYRRNLSSHTDLHTHASGAFNKAGIPRN